jgi:carbon storage regulator
MLVLTRKVGEKIVLDNCIVLQVLEIKGSRIRLGIESPPDVHVWRGELIVTDEAPRNGHAGAGCPAPV